MNFLRLRRPVQIAALLLLAGLPWLNRSGWTGMRGTLFAFDFFGLPLADPLGFVQVTAAGGTPGLRLVLGAGAVLAAAALLGRAFCSWLCPFGLFSEGVRALRPGKAPGPLRHGFRTRLVVTCAGLVLCVAAGAPLLNRISLPGSLSLAFLDAALPAGEASGAGAARDFAALAWSCLLPAGLVLTLEGICGKRIWCGKLCPQSVLLSLAAHLSSAGWRLERTPGRCACDPRAPRCRAACSLGLEPRNARSASRLECTNCGACVTACARACAQRGEAPRLSLRFGTPPRAQARPDASAFAAGPPEKPESTP